MGDQVAGEGTSAPQPSRARLRRGDSASEANASFRPRTEHTREREALQHLHAWIAVNQSTYTAVHRKAFLSATADNKKPVPPPEPCSDATLAAFAQLCALRLQVRRVLVTIMSKNVEYVLTEATRTMSLHCDLVDDEIDRLWLGTCSFPRACGLSGLAIEGWRKARSLREVPPDPHHYYQEGRSAHWYIISDLRNQHEYNHLPFVQHASFLRFFAAIPLRSLNGTVIGSLAVLDDKPRYGVSSSEMILMEDAASNISEHLEGCIVRSQRQRSASLIQALSLFNKQKGTLRDWWFAQDDDRITRSGRHMKTTADEQDQEARANDEFGVQDLELSDSTVSSRRQLRREDSADSMGVKEMHSPVADNNAAIRDMESEGIGASDFDLRPSAQLSETPRFVGDDNATTPVEVAPELSVGQQQSKSSETSSQRRQSFDLYGATKDTYARATNLMREALRAEAVVCVDAKAASSKMKNTLRGDRESSSGGADGSTSNGGTRETLGRSTSDTDLSDTGASVSETCKVLGFSTRNRSSLTGTRSSRHRFGLTERELQTLIRRHPNGKIFDYEENGNLYSSSGDESTSGSNDRTLGQPRAVGRKPRTKHAREAQRLGEVMLGARTIAFYPIWDDGTNGWRSCIFVWCTTPMRFFDPSEDITYLIAFSHSLLAELSRAETVASDHAKATFISSMSHELRSPLHGVLAGIELIQDSQLTPFQQQMATTVSVAGRILLDTINHILDYSKISRLAKTQRREQAVADASRHHSALKSDPSDSPENFSVDLCQLTEEIVETTVSGHRHLGLPNGDGFSDDQSSSKPSRQDSKDSQRTLDALSVTLNIQKRNNWNVDIAPGAWTRIVANLVGNSLKYTNRGAVAIELSARDIPSEDGSHCALVSLKVKDSGIGMTKRFLDSDIYTPFKQANSHSSGTGLGLSIVKQIAKEISADVLAKSELGKGTTMTLAFRATFDKEAREGELHFIDEQTNVSTADLQVQHLRMLTLNAQMQHSQSGNAGIVANSVMRTAADWLDCHTSTGLALDQDMSKAVCAISESDLVHLIDAAPDALSDLLSDIAARGFQMIVLGRSIAVPSDISFEGFPVKPIFVPQPIGPRKLLRAITAGEDPIAPNSLRSYSMPNDAGVKTPLVFKAINDDKGNGEVEGADSFPWHASSSTGSRTPGKTTNPRAHRPSLAMPTTSQAKSFSAQSVDSARSALPMLTTPSTTELVGEPSANTAGLPTENSIETQKGTTALLVEDNEVNMNLLMALMRKLKIPYQCATNGKEAFDVYRAAPQSFLFLLMDIDMPIMNGIESMTRIREFERRQRLDKTFTVALTGVTSAELRISALNAGMDRFYSKPIRMKDLSSLIAEVRGATEGTGP